MRFIYSRYLESQDIYLFPQVTSSSNPKWKIRNHQDQKSGNWWLKVNDKDVIGYWPGSLFTSLGKEATRVEWGGEIINSRSGGRHGPRIWEVGISLTKGLRKLAISGIL